MTEASNERLTRLEALAEDTLNIARSHARSIEAITGQGNQL